MTLRRSVHLRRMGTSTVQMGSVKASKPSGSGALRVSLGFALIVATGVALLLMPFASAEGEAASPLEAIFTTVSAICVTGLVVVDTQSQWSFFGEAVLAVLIQIGGLGYMAGLGVVLWVLGHHLGLRDRNLMRLYYGSPSMGEAMSFLRTILIYTVVFEAMGAIALFVGFVIAGVPASQSVWWAVFHTISAFNVAGFNITGADLVPFNDDPIVLLTVAALSLGGSMGTVPVIMALRRLDFQHASLDAKLILSGVAVVMVASTCFIGLAEWGNAGTLGSVGPAQRPILALFQSAMWTSGLSAVDSGLLSDETKLYESALMLVGGGAGSPAGGIKVATAAILIHATIATLRGHEDVVTFGRKIPAKAVRQAGTITFAFVACFLTAMVALMAASKAIPAIDVMYEAASAIGTVGWSTGITPEFGTAGRIILIVAMLVGRFLPLLLVLQMARPRRGSSAHWSTDGVRLG